MIGRAPLPALMLLGLWTSMASAQTVPGSAPAIDREVRSTILPGTPPIRPAPPPVQVMAGGDIALNFPGVDVQAVAKVILGDTLHVRYSVDPSLHGPVTVRTAHPIRRGDVLAFFEQSLTAANLVLADQGGTYTIIPAATARGEAPVVAANDLGYGNETIALKFVNAEELRKLLDPLVPNAISVADPASNLLVVSGNSTQRRALRELVAQFDVDWLRGMSFGLFVPERTDARLIAPELEKLLNAPGSPSAGLVRLIAMDQLNGILAISPQPQYLDDVRRFVEILDREGESAERRVFVYHVQNGRAADLAKVLNTAYGNAQTGGSNTDTGPTELVDRTESKAPNSVAATNPLVAGLLARAATAAVKNENAAAEGARGGSAGSGTTITADETNNAIVVFSTPRDFALIEDALRKLDVPPLQVMIDATISEVTLNHALQYGIQWSFKSGNSSGALTQPNAAGIATNIPQQNFPGFSYLYSGGSVTATLNALATITDVTTLSAPKLMVLNNHTATIQVGDQVPISTGTAVSTLTTPAPIVNSIDYRDTGIILKITPRVNAGGLVLLDIAQEVSDVVPLSTTQIASGIQSPTIEQRKISTSVAVQDGETVALGGLIKNEVQKGRSTIPILGSIPIIGHIFGDTTGGLIRTELVVLLTPRVVRTPVDARTITEQLRGKLEEAPGPPPPPPPKVSTRRARHGP
ncbi:MAG TPA: type II secretion system secretin GspD [Caulobacteraceae bacterium]|jgi:general secretion pathway protein D